MLSQPYRDILAQTTTNALNLAARPILVDSVRNGSLDPILPLHHKPDELAAEILSRIGVTVGTGSGEVRLDPMGAESAERWAGKLAGSVAGAIIRQNVRRLFVFDDFPTTTLPDETIVETPLPEGT